MAVGSFLLIMGLMTSVLSHQRVHGCELGQFYDVTQDACKECSRCKNNEITRQLCGEDKDTVCGPFYEFAEFLESLKLDKNTVPHTSTASSTDHDASDVRSSQVTWYGITVSLIGVLCFMSVLLAVLVTLLCVMVNKRKSGFRTNCSLERQVEAGRVLDVDCHSDRLVVVPSEKLALVAET